MMRSVSWIRTTHTIVPPYGGGPRPILVVITPPTYPGLTAAGTPVLLQAVAFTMSGVRAGAIEGKIYYVDAPTYAAAANKTECAVGSWADKTITATFPSPVGVGKDGWIIIEDAAGRRSAGKPVLGLALLTSWNFSTSLPTTIVTDEIETAVVAAVNGTDAVYQIRDLDGGVLAAGRFGYWNDPDWAADKSVLYAETDLLWAWITAAHATNGIIVSRLAKDAVMRAVFEIANSDADPTVIRAKVRDAADATLINGDYVNLARAGWHTLRHWWRNQGGTLRYRGWCDTTPLTFGGQAEYVAPGYGAMACDHLDGGMTYNNDGTLAGTVASPQTKLIDVRRERVWGA